MDNSFETLARRCRRYWLKRYAFYTLGAVALFAVIGVGVYYTTAPTLCKEPTALASGHIEAAPAAPAAVPVKKTDAPEPLAPKKPEPSSAKSQASPSAPPPNAQSAEPAAPVQAAVKTEPAKPLPPKTAVTPAPKAAAETARNPSSGGLVMQVKEVTSVETMIKQYDQEPHYGLALQIAQKYYDDAAYDDASLWAKKANLLHKEDPRSWILFAKSQYAKGERQKAKTILRLYLDNKASVEAESLLMTWMHEEE